MGGGGRWYHCHTPWLGDSKDDQGSSSNVRTGKELCVKEAYDKERMRLWLCALEVFQLSTLQQGRAPKPHRCLLHATENVGSEELRDHCRAWPQCADLNYYYITILS